MSDEQPQVLSPEPGSGEQPPEDETPAPEAPEAAPEPEPLDDEGQAAQDAASTQPVDYEHAEEAVPHGEYPAEGTFGYVSGDGEGGDG